MIFKEMELKDDVRVTALTDGIANVKFDKHIKSGDIIAEQIHNEVDNINYFTIEYENENGEPKIKEIDDGRTDLLIKFLEENNLFKSD